MNYNLETTRESVDEYYTMAIKTATVLVDAGDINAATAMNLAGILSQSYVTNLLLNDIKDLLTPKDVRDV